MDDDLEIVNRVKAGDSAAFSELVHKYKKPILNLIYRLMGSADEAEDLAQEAFLRAYRGLSKFEARAKFFTWLYRIAMNVALRARKRRSRYSFESLEQKVENGSSEMRRAIATSSGPSSKMEKREMQEIVKKAIGQLPDEQRSVVILYRYENLSYEEISKVLNVSLPAVKSRLHRARKNLKDLLAEYV